ncbi:YfhO family protein [uncultured Ruminococcus sp.]|uniref:YfhO family protein n=1 Tax=uncultured Ruminococcus sp. TaxID=165186 RepID=UPI0025CD2E5D|nr:YfhO family protein [uncultured Ruminococcus sp.]
MKTIPKNKLSSVLTVISAPLAIMIILLLTYRSCGAYPFGDKSIAWGDMVQQTVPLLMDFKDILDGKDGVFLNFANASGMDMWAVIFFFMASPFTFLVKFVDKADMLYFMNILVMLKLMTCGGTASFYLHRTFRRLDPLWVTGLGILYGLCGYGLMYYQNIIWLDMMYLFPLLLMAMERLCEKKRVLPYTLTLAAMMAVNYYIGYMVVIFIMLFAGLTLTALRRDKTDGMTAVRFIIGSLMAALLSAAVWLPSLIQYTHSGRVKEEFFSMVKNADFLTKYETTLPTVMCSSFVLTAVLIFSCDGKPRSKKLNRYLILSALMLIPLLIEPINLMWHTGSYMSFPSRYGFITVFMLTVCAAAYLEDSGKLRTPEAKKHTDHPALISVLFLLTFELFRGMLKYTQKHIDTASRYTTELWGDKGSFSVCASVFFVMAAASAVMIVLYRKSLVGKKFTALICTAIIICEACCQSQIYLTGSIHYYPERTADNNTVYELADRIDDSSMFRVKTDRKLFHVNLVGAMGYGSIGHYTSLNSQDYMFMMKHFGYSSSWMDVGSFGGTEITDLLMSVKYTITFSGAENAVYEGERYSIVENDMFLPSGLVLNDISGAEGELPDLTRAEMQQYIYDNTLRQYGESAVTVYELGGTRNGVGFKADCGESYTADIHISGRQALYFDAFDRPEVSLTDRIENSFDVFVNDDLVKLSYPNEDINGLLKLGDFEDEDVSIRVSAKKSISLRSLGIAAIDTDKLYSAAESAQTVDFARHRGKLSGSVDAKAGQYCLINVPYTEGLRVKVNGKKAPCIRVFGDLTAVELDEGGNDITVTAVPEGFTAGILLTAAGALLCVLWHFVIGRQLKIPEKPAKALTWAFIAASGAVFAVIYLLPTAMELVCKEY